MMSGVTGLWTEPQRNAQAVSNQADSANSADAGSATISANDFLTLLVTEMQNQDPTANTDPNEYINQLVQVNSLEQLISINQTLLADSTTSGGSNPAAPPVGEARTQNASRTADAVEQIAGNATIPTVSGNLTVPQANPSALRVAQSLAHPISNR